MIEPFRLLNATRWKALSVNDQHPNIVNAVDQSTGCSVVVKFPRAHGLEINPDYDVLLYEAELLSRWKNNRVPGIVDLIESSVHSEPPFLVLESLGDSLYDLVPSDSQVVGPDDGMEIEDFRKLMSDVVITLEAIHKLGNAHRDIHPANILFDSAMNRWKLIDPIQPGAIYPEGFYSRYVPDNWERDIYGMACVFLFAYRGAIADRFIEDDERDVLEGRVGSKFLKLLDRALYDGKDKKRPTARQFREAIRAMSDLPT